jgi:2-polyprenyl-3-methyl-5-hydroxy-6-metoxy-1,4-benzoquinol methylase
MLKTSFSEFHSGYRLYSTRALREIPFERNSNNFHFDTEIIIQLVMKGLKIVELPIPTYYGDEICYVNGMRYAWDVFRAMMRARFHERNLLYDRKFDVGPAEETYDLKLGFASSHTLAIDLAKAGTRIIDIGCGRGYVAEEFAKKGAIVTGVDQFAPESSLNPKVEFHKWDLDSENLPVDVSKYDQIFMLDIIEHLKDPEVFMEQLRHASVMRRPEIIITTANISFFVTRLMLLFGHFNYGRQGILDRTHTRLFTFSSLAELLNQTGYKIVELGGIPAPYPKAIGDNIWSRALLAINQILIKISRRLFSYQIFVRAQAMPTVEHLLSETIHASEAMRQNAQLPMEMTAAAARERMD